MLLNTRYQYGNLFQSIVGVWLFASVAPLTVHSFLSRVGLSTSYKTTRLRLKGLADEAEAHLASLGEAIRTGKEAYIILFDNINKSVHGREQTISNNDAMQCGTAATAVLMDDLPEGWNQPKVLAANRALKLRRHLTVDDLWADVDWEHSRGVAVGGVMRLLVKHIPELNGLHSAVEDLFKGRWAKQRMQKGRKSTVRLVQAIGARHSTSCTRRGQL